ncbi:MAG: hypothetical protein WAW87_09700 [Candidatus Ferrigenium altingense]
MLPPDSLNRYVRFLLKQGILALVVFVSTYSANLWFEKQKSIDNIKLNDSNVITTRANELWSLIFKLESDYSRLDDLRAKQDVEILFELKTDNTVQKNIDSKAREILDQHEDVLHSISESSHIIGKPLFHHMALYMSLLQGYYGMKDNSRRARQIAKNADISFMDKQVQDTGTLLFKMRSDIASTREYALQQVNR